MPGLGLQGGFGVGAGVDQATELRILLQRELEAKARQDAEAARLAENARQFNAELPIKTGTLDVSRGHLGVARDKLTQDADQFAALEPDRQSVINLRNLQGGEIARQPQAEADQFRRKLDELNAQNLMQTGAQTQRQQGAIELANINNAADLKQAQIAASTRTALQSEPVVEVEMPDGSRRYVPRSEASGMKVATSRKSVLGTERAALSYFNRAQEADKTAAPLEDEIAKMSLPGQAALQYLPNWLQSQTGQSYRQAQRAFTEARLRKESGAAIPTAEYENDQKTYWARPGDSAKTIADKRAARQEVLDGLGFSAAGAYQEFYGEPFQRKAQSAAKSDVPPSGPQPGQRRNVNGKTYEWDGKGWFEVR
jgi:hypothetical protein